MMPSLDYRPLPPMQQLADNWFFKIILVTVAALFQKSGALLTVLVLLFVGEYVSTKIGAWRIGEKIHWAETRRMVSAWALYLTMCVSLVWLSHFCPRLDFYAGLPAIAQGFLQSMDDYAILMVALTTVKAIIGKAYPRKDMPPVLTDLAEKSKLGRWLFGGKRDNGEGL